MTLWVFIDPFHRLLKPPYIPQYECRDALGLLLFAVMEGELQKRGQEAAWRSALSSVPGFPFPFLLQAWCCPRAWERGGRSENYQRSEKEEQDHLTSDYPFDAHPNSQIGCSFSLAPD